MEELECSKMNAVTRKVGPGVSGGHEPAAATVTLVFDVSDDACIGIVSRIHSACTLSQELFNIRQKEASLIARGRGIKSLRTFLPPVDASSVQGREGKGGCTNGVEGAG